jgi:hypothetical protein
MVKVEGTVSGLGPIPLVLGIVNVACPVTVPHNVRTQRPPIEKHFQNMKGLVDR